MIRKSNLYFFPYAGASSITFKSWKKRFAPEVDFKLIDYAGHGKRKLEPFYSSVSEACEDMYKLIKEDNKEGNPYYLAGHCLGAIIALELCYLIRERAEINLPAGIFISGQGTPDAMVEERLSQLEDRELLEYLSDFNLIDKSMLEEDVFDIVQSLIIAPVKADAKIYEDYVYNHSNPLEDIELYIMYGLEDHKYAESEMKNWGKFSNGRVEYLAYPEGHYFIDALSEVCAGDIKKAILES